VGGGGAEKCTQNFWSKTERGNRRKWGEITLILILNTIGGRGVAFVNTVMNVRFLWEISESV